MEGFEHCSWHSFIAYFNNINTIVDQEYDVYFSPLLSDVGSFIITVIVIKNYNKFKL